MDLSIIIGTLIDLLKLLVVFSIIGFVLYKIFSPLREKIAEKYSLSWSKSCILLNFSVFFVLILLVFIMFMILGYLDAPLRDPETEYTFFENVMLVLIAVPRILISSIILSLLAFFFELVASFFMGEVRRNKKRDWVSEVKGIMVSTFLFLILFLFVFNWVPLGLFIYIFYGSIKALPLMVLV
ncbi:MAG: hypothetical protein WCX66_01540 [archaeon]